MKVGLLARAEDRGLGLLSWEVQRHLAPDVTVVVDMGALARGFPMHLERFPGAVLAAFTGTELDPGPVRAMLEACDVVWVAETFYDERLPGWAQEAGCRLVVHVMPEFFRWGAVDLPGVSWWAPTPWRLDRLPAGTRLVPIPVAADRFLLAPAPAGDRLRVLHPVGHRAGADRAGTLVMLQTLRYLKRATTVVLRSQDDRLPKPSLVPGHVDVVVETGGVEDYWNGYGDVDVLVMPRRYGGLSLPVQEGMAAGLAVVMPDVDPNGWWPTLRVPCRRLQDYPTPGGVLRLADTSPRALAAVLDGLSDHPADLAAAKEAAVQWAADHSWQALEGLWRDELTLAAG